MSSLQFIKSIYSLDTLDTRFTTSSKTPLSRKNDENSIADAKLPAQQVLAQSPLPGAQPSKWKTPEFYFYYLCFLTLPALMTKAVYDVSRPGSPNWDNVSKLLSPGWIPGRQVDNSDAQYSSFRDNIPYMTLVLILHPVLRRLYGSFWRIDSYTQVRQGPGDDSGLSQGLSPSAAADARLEHRISFDLGFAFLFITALHGISAFKVLLILYINYKLATQLPRSYVPLVTWGFNVGILFANELCHGYPLAGIVSLLLPAQTTAAGRPSSGNWGSWFDNYGGLLPRWEILFNITVLRLISFNFDYYWGLEQNRGASPIEVSTPPRSCRQ